METEAVAEIKDIGQEQLLQVSKAHFYILSEGTINIEQYLYSILFLKV
jgi:hypothetical protein